MITVFYDGQCGLCSREINHYKKIAPPGSFNWQDITQSKTTLENESISYTQGLKVLHAKDSAGKMHRGIDAFILIWKQIKYWKILAHIIALPVIKQCAAFAYQKFAEYRFKKLGYCEIQKQET